MELSADLNGFPIAQVMHIITHGKHSGLLGVGRDGTRVTIVFLSGRIMYASSTSLQQIGSALIEKGIVSKEDVDRALAIQKETNPHRPIATILAEMGLVTEEVLVAETRNHIKTVLREVLAWENGALAFKNVRVNHDLLILKFGVEIESLLLDAVFASPGAQCTEGNNELDEELRSFLP